MSAEHELAFPTLTSAQMEGLRRFGTERRVTEGEVLFQEGDRGFCFYVVLDGAVEIVEHSSGTPHTVTVHHPGEFTGDVDTLTGRAALVTGRVRGSARLLELDRDRLRQAVGELPEFR